MPDKIRKPGWKHIGWWLHHPKFAPSGEFETLSLTEGDRKAGWSQKPAFVEDTNAQA